MRELIGFEDARRLVLQSARVQPAEAVPLGAALGRTLAEAVVSREAVPPFDNSAMDGYAVRTADLAALPAVLRIADDIPAGRRSEQTVQPGTAARITTGAPVPPGVDAIVPVEWTEAEGEYVRIERAPRSGQYVRPAGQDVQPGDVLVPAGTIVTPAVIGMAATLGYGALQARVPPRVAVVATGDELVDASSTLGPGQIRDSNGPALAAQVVTAGGVPLGPLRARDDDADLTRALETAHAADVLVLSGGVSMGHRDRVRPVLTAMGFEAVFWRVRQRPGKPLLFGMWDGQPVLGLPGNPVSSAVCFEAYVRPLLAAMLGRTEVVRPLVSAILDADVPAAEGLHHLVRVTLRHDDSGQLHARPTGPQASNLYSSFLAADGLLHVLENAPAPSRGDVVRVQQLS